MPVPKGTKFGGRQKGTPNKATSRVNKLLEEMDCDPIKGMAEIAKRAMNEGDLELAFKNYKELAGYVAPKRKSVELEADITIHDEVQELSDDELLEGLEELGLIESDD